MSDAAPSNQQNRPGTPGTAGGVRPSTRFRNRVLKWVRRAHLYTGLLLLPWVVFFGFSGMLFNHPGLGELDQVAAWSGREVAELGFEAIDPDELAVAIVADLNRSAVGRDLRLVPGGTRIDGAFVLQGQAGGGALTLTIDPRDGSAVLNQARETAKPGAPDFVSVPVLAGERPEIASLGKTVADLIERSGIESAGALEPSSRGGAELRFQVESATGDRRWNLSWNLLRGGLTARESGAGSGLDLYSVLTRFHKTHHYPQQFGARWLWSAFADATGLTMVFWGLSGAIMWWQIKPTRLLGITGLSVAGVLAFCVFAGTYSNLHWTPRESRPPGTQARQAPPEKAEAPVTPTAGERATPATP